MNGFKLDFSKIIEGGAQRASFFFSRAPLSVSAFSLDCRALCVLDSGFASSPSTFDWGACFGPKNKFLDSPFVRINRDSDTGDEDDRHFAIISI